MNKLLLIAALAFTANAEDIVITTGQQGMTYNAVYGVNLQGALAEFGNKVTVVTSKGSLDNLDKVAAGSAQIGFTQADAYQFWRSKHANEAQNVDIVGELSDECVFVAVKDGGKINGEDDLKAGEKIAVGEPSFVSVLLLLFLCQKINHKIILLHNHLLLLLNQNYQHLEYSTLSYLLHFFLDAGRVFALATFDVGSLLCILICGVVLATGASAPIGNPYSAATIVSAPFPW